MHRGHSTKSLIQGQHLTPFFVPNVTLIQVKTVFPQIFFHSIRRFKLAVTSLGSGSVTGSSFSGVFTSSVGSGSFGFSGGGGILAPKLQYDNLNERNERCFH